MLPLRTSFNLELKNSGLNLSLPDFLEFSVNARRARRARPTLPQASCFLEFQIQIHACQVKP